MAFMNSERLKSLFIFCLVTLFLSSLFLLVPYGRTLAQSEKEREAKLVEAAKKEGKITWYTSISVPDALTLIKGFNAKYPFIKVNLFRSSSVKLMSRIITEADLGKHMFDVVMSSSFAALMYQERGYITSYYSPERKFFADEFKDKNGYWTGNYFNTHVIGYNTRMVRPSDVPRSYEDLLDPKWKGKLGIDIGTDAKWFATQLEIMGKEKGLDFFRRLGNQKLSRHKGHTLLAQLCVAGEFAIAVNVYGGRSEQLIAAGAPIDWVAVNPVVFHANGNMLGKNAPHPNAAKLFIDYVLSRKGQEVIRDVKRIPCRSDVLPDPARLVKGLKFQPMPDKYLSKNYDKVDKQFNDLMKGK
jgi:iron(III) transport system substrate-binding protein